MKRFTLLFVVFICCLTAKTQEIQVQVSEKSSKYIFEQTQLMDKHFLYGYAELLLNDASSTYVQVFHEYELKKKTKLHIEYRSFLLDGEKWQNTYLVGLSLNMIRNNILYIDFSPLYRFENKHLWQTTFTYGVSYKNITFDGYFDLYGSKKADAFSENKLKIHIDKFILGVNLEYSLYESVGKMTPYVMLGIKL